MKPSIDLGLAVLAAVNPGQPLNPYEIADVCECSYAGRGFCY